MNSLTQFLVGSAFVFGLALLAVVVYAIRALSAANVSFRELAEVGVLASRSSNSEDLAKALIQRDQAKADRDLLKEELQKAVPHPASLVPSSAPMLQSNDPDLVEIAGIPLRRTNR